MPTRKRLFSVCLVAVICLSLSAVAPVKKLSATGFMGRTENTTVIVDTDLAAQIRGEKFFPLIVWLGHTDRKSQKATRESFTLSAPSGEKLAMAAFSEVISGYGSNRISADYSRLRMNEIHYDYAAMQFLSYRQIRGVAFFPNPSGAEVNYDTVELSGFTWFRALLYFPLPSGKAHGDYILRYSDAKGTVTVEVPFSLPSQEK